MRKVIMVMVLLLGGCQSWSEVTGNRFSATMLNRRTAVIDQIDNQASFSTDPIRIEPGEHRLIVLGSAPGWPGGPPSHVYRLNAEPCKRYYINAQFKDAISQEWTPVIDYVETISECKIVPATK
jgi:hypothetical protein